MVDLKDHEPAIYATGLPSVDSVLGGGFAPGELVIVGASTSHGKTLVGLQLGYNASLFGHTVLIVSEEMTPQTLADRGILAATEIPQADWRSKWDEVFDDVVRWEDQHAGDIMLPPVPCHSITKTVVTIAEAVVHYGIKIAIVDYLQLLSASGTTKYEQVSNVSRELKQAAVEHNIAVVALAQLNRSPDKEGNGIPKIHHLSDSGQIERDADVILLLQWPHRTNRDYQPANEYRVVVAKNRNRGIQGEPAIELRIEPMRQRIVDPKSDVKAHRNYRPELDSLNDDEYDDSPEGRFARGER
jgi:replicative DNA helicase